MQIELQTVIALGVPVVGAGIWLLRLEGRVNITESRYADLRIDLAEIKKDLKDLTGRP